MCLFSDSVVFSQLPMPKPPKQEIPKESLPDLPEHRELKRQTHEALAQLSIAVQEGFPLWSEHPLNWCSRALSALSRTAMLPIPRRRSRTPVS